MSTVKTFKYLSNPGTDIVQPVPKPGSAHKGSNNKKVTGKNGRVEAVRSHSPHRQNSKKKIRVRDGDKCVPPAKSKAKTRIHLVDTDLG